MRQLLPGWLLFGGRVRVLAVVCLLGAVVSTVALLTLLPRFIVTVHVRWAPEAGPSERIALEEAFGLDSPDQLDDRTWKYTLRDPSTSTIRAIVRHPAVEDTAHLNRRWFRPAFGVDRLRLAALFGGLAGLALVMALIVVEATGRLLRHGSEWRRWAMAAALIVGLSVSVRVWQIPMQVTDSLVPMLQAQAAPGASPTHFLNERGFLRPLYWTQIRTLLTLAGDGHYHLVFKGAQIALVLALFLGVAAAVPVATSVDFAAFVFSLLVLVGMPTFTGMVSEAYPVNHYLEVAVASVAALVLLQGTWRPWKDVAAVTLLAAALFTLESGLLVLVVIVAGLAVGWKGVSFRGLAGALAVTALYFYLRVEYLGTGVPDLSERSTGFGIARLEPAETVALFAGREGLLYIYNIAASILGVFFSEPRGGQFVAMGAWLSDSLRPIHILTVASSTATTLCILAVLISLARTRFRALTDTGRIALVAIGTIVGNAAFCVVYVKDEIMSTAGVFYALAAFAAVQWVMLRLQDTPARRVPAALLAVLLLASGLAWQARALSLHYRLYAVSGITRGEWTNVDAWLDDQRVAPTDEDGRRLVRQLREDAVQRPIRDARFAPRWMSRWLD